MKPSLFLFVPLLGACVDPIDDTTSEATSEIQNGSTPSQWVLDRAIAIVKNSGEPGCTATRITAHHAITAAHCAPALNSQLRFYTGSSAYNQYLTATVAGVTYPPGVNGPLCHDDSSGCFNSQGVYADIAIIYMQTDVVAHAYADPVSGPQAVLAWTYPGEGYAGTKVGAGNHNFNDNPTGILRVHADRTGDTNRYGSGEFETDDYEVNAGDSGGPFYIDNRITGVLHGWGNDSTGTTHDRYTKVEAHLDWILGTIGYRWQGLPSLASTRYYGTGVGAFQGTTERECQYACENTTTCDAYNYFAGSSTCEMMSNVTATTDSSSRGALRFGASSGKTGDVVGYVRSDGYSSIVHAGTDGRLRELWNYTSWDSGIIQGNAPTVASKLTAYRRADGFNAVVYRSTSNEIIELYLDGTWKWASLSAWGGKTPVGDPVAYVRADGVSAVAYRCATNHICELRQAGLGWVGVDITQSTNAPIADSDPHAFARSDGYSSVVYRSGFNIIELYKGFGETWSVGYPSSLTHAWNAQGKPFGYNHANGTPAIIYRSTTGKLIEMYLTDAWHITDLSLATGAPNLAGDPFAYVRTDAMESIVFRGTNSDIYEVANAPWGVWNLSLINNNTVPSARSNPTAFVRRDGTNSVLFEQSDDDVTQLAFKRGDAWYWNNLSTFTLEP